MEEIGSSDTRCKTSSSPLPFYYNRPRTSVARSHYSPRSFNPKNMVIHPELRANGPALSPQQTRAISAWTEQATASLGGMTLSEQSRDEPISVGDAPSTRTGLRGASVSLAIPLDDDVPAAERTKEAETGQKNPSVTYRRREPIRRDSLKRREALLKGKDGSRRRQRWENGL